MMKPQAVGPVGIVIPAHNEEASLSGTLSALKAQDCQDREGLDILVVDDGSTDRTAAVAAAHGARVLSQRPNRGLARSIQAGLDDVGARGSEIGIVLHADCVPLGTGWVRAMTAPFADPSVGAVVSARRLAATPKGAERFFDAVAPQDFPNPEGRDRDIGFFRDKCDAYRLSAVQALGGFDTRAFHVAGEDTDLSLRMRAAGGRIVQSGAAVVAIGFSSHQRSLSRVLRKALQYGGAQAVLWRRHGYDGLKARAYASGILAAGATALAVAGLSWTAWALLVPALAMQATTTIAAGVPLVCATVALGAALQAAGFLSAATAWAVAAAGVPAALAARQAWKAARRMRAHGEGAAAAAQGAAVAWLWWMLTGWGYGRAWTRQG